MFRPVYVVGAALTALWLFVVWFWVESEIGWDTMGFMLPWENLVFAAAVLVPVGLIWLVTAFIELADRNRINHDTLFELAQRMAEATPRAREEAKALSEEIASQVANLAAFSGAATAARKDLAKLEESAEQTLRTVTERTASDTAEVRKVYRGFVDDVAKTAEETAGQIRNAIETSIEATLSDDLKTSASRLEAEAQTITSASRDFTQHIDEIEAHLESQRAKLAEATAEATEKAREMRETFGAQGKELSAMSELMSTKIAQIHEALESQISLLKRTIESMAGQIDTLDKKSGSVGGKVEAIGATLHALVDETIDAELERVGTATGDVGKKIKLVADEVAMSLDGALNEQLKKMEGAASKLSDDIAELNKTMNQSSEQLDKVVRTTAEEAQETVSLFHAQVERLSHATREAAEQTDAVREAVAQGRRDGFLRASAAVIRELNELAVEIDRVFEPSLPDNIMKLYQDGDHGIFVRRIARANEEHSVPMIRERMRKDVGFRSNVQTFMKRYESLLAQTSECDPDRILTATFLTADVGKVYMLLTRANQKEH
jgi:chromosome segregation ATPase